MLSTTSSTLKTQKKALRKAVSSVLRSLGSAYIREQSSAVAAKVLSLSSFRQCKSVSCYLNMPMGELDTSSIVKEILSSGKTLFVPKIDVGTEGKMDFLQVYDQEDLQLLPAGMWGIREPGMEYNGVKRTNALEPPSELDMILVPGVAFDRSMARLGHGKGYYDRYITSYIATGRPRPLLVTFFACIVALALREQLMDNATSTNYLVPMGEHDWKMDIIVTPDEVLHVER
ncbi:nagb/rpia/CoA transferase-like protein [Dendrothele bispora CBS 962.96]|uniref:5-formyltetrahydrofolate cyclo-ligase n=1 Tax=Dendrothele bispora (strain CBS 962.96) TaxID=1314807 RepID=A0A4S8LKM6_DENBC|nr:nagb/rpia/CoA transferase-like protein [Dendrothele bispora CBS 962.96]